MNCSRRRQVFYWVTQLCPVSGLAPVHTGNLRAEILEDTATCSAAADGTREAASRPGQKIQDFMLVCVTDMQQLGGLPEHRAQALHILAKHGRHLVTASQVVQDPAFQELAVHNRLLRSFYRATLDLQSLLTDIFHI